MERHSSQVGVQEEHSESTLMQDVMGFVNFGAKPTQRSTQPEIPHRASPGHATHACSVGAADTCVQEVSEGNSQFLSVSPAPCFPSKSKRRRTHHNLASPVAPQCGSHRTHEDAAALHEGNLATSEEAVVAASRRGVCVRWLVQWTTARRLWTVPTWRVVEEVIKPLTMSRQCRFVDLCSQEFDLGDSPIVGPAHAFISHVWAREWGELVAAAQQVSWRGRRVWIDCLAVNQHQPTTDLVLLQRVIGTMPEGVLVVIDPSTCHKGYNPFRRAWCVWEVVNAIRARVPMIIKMGRKIKHAETSDWKFQVEWDIASVQELADSISLQVVTASRPEDLKSIMAHIYLHFSLFEVEETIRHAVWAGWTSRNLPALHLAVQGHEVLHRSGLNIESTNPEGWTALHCAAACGLTGAVGVLLKIGARIEATSAKGRTALIHAAWSGQPATVKQLLAAGANLHHQDIHGNTASRYAAQKFRKEKMGNEMWRECLELLENYARPPPTRKGPNS